MILIFEFCEIPQLLLVGTCGADDWCVVIRNPGEMCCWNDLGHGVCDQNFGNQDVGPVKFLVYSKNCQGRPNVFF